MALSGIGAVHCGERTLIFYKGYYYLNNGSFFDGTSVDQCKLYDCRSSKSLWLSLNAMFQGILKGEVSLYC